MTHRNTRVAIDAVLVQRTTNLIVAFLNMTSVPQGSNVWKMNGYDDTWIQGSFGVFYPSPILEQKFGFTPNKNFNAHFFKGEWE